MSQRDPTFRFRNASVHDWETWGWQGLDLNDHIFTKYFSISKESILPVNGKSDLLCCSPSFHQFLILYNIAISSPRRLDGFDQPMSPRVYRIQMYCCCRSDGACCYKEKDTSGSLLLLNCPPKARQEWRFSDLPSRLSERVGRVVRALDTLADSSLALDHRELRRGCRNLNMLIFLKVSLIYSRFDVFSLVYPFYEFLRKSSQY